MADQEYIRSLPFEMAAASGDGLTLEGYAAVFDSPAQIEDWAGKYEETIAPGAFKRTLQERMPVLMFEHGTHPLIGKMPLGVIERAQEDTRGLHIQARLSDNWLIQPVRDAVRDKAVTGMSFRFSTPKGGDVWGQRNGSVTRRVNDLDARELGPVVFPAYTPTTASVRSILDRLPNLTGQPDTGSVGGGDDTADVTPGNGEPSPEQLSIMQARDRDLRFRGIIRHAKR